MNPTSSHHADVSRIHGPRNPYLVACPTCPNLAKSFRSLADARMFAADHNTRPRRGDLVSAVDASGRPFGTGIVLGCAGYGVTNVRWTTGDNAGRDTFWTNTRLTVTPAFEVVADFAI